MNFKYEIINPITNKKRPFYDTKRGLFYFHTKTNYRYFLETIVRKDKYGDEYDFYILLSKEKFNPNCRKCQVDDYKRCKFKPNGILKEYLIDESKERSNFDIEYIETIDNYDIYLLK